MRDLSEIANGSLVKILTEFTEKVTNHVFTCQLCKAKGYICAYCNSEEQIYPFQLKLVIQCKGCDNFFHRNCYQKDNCPTCNRRLMNHAKAYSTH